MPELLNIYQPHWFVFQQIDPPSWLPLPSPEVLKRKTLKTPQRTKLNLPRANGAPSKRIWKILLTAYLIMRCAGRQSFAKETRPTSKEVNRIEIRNAVGLPERANIESTNLASPQ